MPYFDEDHSESTNTGPVTPGGPQRIPSTPPRTPPRAPSRTLGSPFKYQRAASPSPPRRGRGISMSPNGDFAPPVYRHDDLHYPVPSHLDPRSPNPSRPRRSMLASRIAVAATTGHHDHGRLRHRIQVQQGVINTLRYDLNQSRDLYRDAIESKQRLRDEIVEIQEYQDALEAKLARLRQELANLQVDKAEFEETISWLWLEKSALRDLTERLQERYGIEEGEEVELDHDSPHPDDDEETCTWCYVRRSRPVERQRNMSI